MPRVTEAHRQARRDEIAEAALRVLARNGVANTSIAQIVEESGLSAGAIYANFVNKAELARYIAQTVFDWRMQRITASADAFRTPVEVMRALLLTTREERPPLELVLQFWAEAVTDPDLHAVMSAKVELLRDTFRAAVSPWAEARDPEDAEALAARTATAMVVVCQGYLTNASLLGWMTPDEYLSSAEALFAAG